MMSRLAMVGDPRGFRGLLGEGDPFGFGFITRAITGGGRAALRILGLGGRRALPAATGGFAGPLASRAAAAIASRPITSAVVGGVAAGGAGAALEAILGSRGGAMGVPGGFEVLRVSRTGRPTKILTPQGRVVSLVRRRGGISAAAIRGAFKLARLAHAFGATARTGRRPRRRSFR